jgi:hypothetical protein
LARILLFTYSTHHSSSRSLKEGEISPPPPPPPPSCLLFVHVFSLSQQIIRQKSSNFLQNASPIILRSQDYVQTLLGIALEHPALMEPFEVILKLTELKISIIPLESPYLSLLESSLPFLQKKEFEHQNMFLRVLVHIVKTGPLQLLKSSNLLQNAMNDPKIHFLFLNLADHCLENDLRELLEYLVMEVGMLSAYVTVLNSVDDKWKFTLLRKFRKLINFDERYLQLVTGTEFEEHLRDSKSI